jgi:hypothetical protein
MTIQQGTEEVVAPEATQSEEDAAFLAEMASEAVADAPAPVAEEKPVEPKSEEVSSDDKPAEPELAPVREEVVPGYTKEELSAAMAKMQKSLDTTNGTMGSKFEEQRRALEALQKQREGAIGKLTPEKLARVSKEFPELAALLAEDLSDVIAQQGQPVDNSQFEQVNSKVATLEKMLAEKEAAATQKERERAKKELTKAHPDWDKVAMYNVQNNAVVWANPQFGDWFNKQDEVTRGRLLNEVDADYLSEQLTNFKASIKPRAVTQKKVEDAVLPKGGAREVARSDLDEEEAAYRAEMAKR